MTTGEKIKYFRILKNMTQKNLGELCGIDEATIRKYELGTRNPKPTQIEKISAALEVDTSSLLNLEYRQISGKTLGELLSVIITLCNANLATLKGARNEYGHLSADSVYLQLNSETPVFEALQLVPKGDTHSVPLELSEISIKIKDSLVLAQLIKWEFLCFSLNKLLQAIAEHTPTAQENNELANLRKQKDKLEWELKASPVLLKEDDTGICVEIPPDFSQFL